MSTQSETTGQIISVKTALVAVLIAAISFASVVVLSAYAPELRDRRTAGLHAYSTSALGYNFAAELLSRQGYDVQISRDTGNLREASREGILILTPASAYDDDELEEVNFDRNGQPTLVVLPKRNGLRDRTNSRHYGMTVELPLEPLGRLLEPLSGDISLHRIAPADEVQLMGETLPVVFTDPVQVLHPEGIEPVLSIDGGVLLGRVPGTRIYILSDPELMNTHGLAHRENAEILVRLMDQLTAKAGAGHIIFDTTMHGFQRSRDLLRLIFEPPLLGATLFAMATMILLGWAAFLRFGRPQAEPPVAATGRQSLIESTAGLFRQTNREPALAGDYEKLARRMIIRELGYPEDLPIDEMDRILKQREARVRSKHADAPPWPDPAKVRTHSQLMNFVKDFHVWKREMSDERE